MRNRTENVSGAVKNNWRGFAQHFTLSSGCLPAGKRWLQALVCSLQLNQGNQANNAAFYKTLRALSSAEKWIGRNIFSLWIKTERENLKTAGNLKNLLSLSLGQLQGRRIMRGQGNSVAFLSRWDWILTKSGEILEFTEFAQQILSRVKPMWLQQPQQLHPEKGWNSFNSTAAPWVMFSSLLAIFWHCNGSVPALSTLVLPGTCSARIQPHQSPERNCSGYESENRYETYNCYKIDNYYETDNWYETGSCYETDNCY